MFDGLLGSGYMQTNEAFTSTYSLHAVAVMGPW